MFRSHVLHCPATKIARKRIHDSLHLSRNGVNGILPRKLTTSTHMICERAQWTCFSERASTDPFLSASTRRENEGSKSKIVAAVTRV